MMKSYLLLWLEGPMQAWGFDSRFGRRDTLPFPTKSGVLGMLCSALGASGEQHELLKKMSTLRQTVISFTHKSKGLGNTTIAKDREPYLCDFQMVGSGYDDSDPWKALLIPKTSEGKKATGGGTKLTYRYYLQDSCFAVVLEVPKEDADRFSAAMRDPVYDLYLGRKNCVPTEFVFRGCFDDEDSAIQAALAFAKPKDMLEDFRVLDGDHDGESLTLNDIPVQFGVQKKYRDRRVTLIKS